MTFISGFMGLLSAIGPVGSATTEATGVGYARQPARFSVPRNGVSKLAAPFTFGFAAVGQTVGRGLWSQPAGGTLLLVLPYGTGARRQPGGGPIDARDVGDITLFLPAMAAFPDGFAFTGTLTAGTATIGTVYDAIDEGHAPLAMQAGPGGVVPKAIVTAPLYSPIPTELSVLNGSIIVGEA